MTKKYGIRGISEAVLRFEKGKTIIVCPFTNGNLLSREPIPATYSTSNPIIQRVIETSELYLNGKVFLLSQYEETPVIEVKESKPEKEVTPRTKAKTKSKGSKSADAKVMEEVVTYSDAVTALMAEGATVSEVTSMDACIAKAEELNISFPNLK